MSNAFHEPDIRVPEGEARPLTRSEKCSIAGRKGGRATYMKYGPAWYSHIGKKGFQAFVEEYHGNDRAGVAHGLIKGGKWTPR